MYIYITHIDAYVGASSEGGGGALVYYILCVFSGFFFHSPLPPRVWVTEQILNLTRRP